MQSKQPKFAKQPRKSVRDWRAEIDYIKEVDAYNEKHPQFYAYAKNMYVSGEQVKSRKTPIRGNSNNAARRTSVRKLVPGSISSGDAMKIRGLRY